MREIEQIMLSAGPNSNVADDVDLAAGATTRETMASHNAGRDSDVFGAAASLVHEYFSLNTSIIRSNAQDAGQRFTEFDARNTGPKRLVIPTGFQDMSKLPPPDLQSSHSTPLPSWMRLMPKGFPSNCLRVAELPPPDLAVRADPALRDASRFMRIIGSLDAENSNAA